MAAKRKALTLAEVKRINEHNLDKIFVDSIIGYYMFRTFDGYFRFIKDTLTFRNH